MKLEKLANIRVGLPLARKKGDIHDNLYFTYKTVTLKSFSFTGALLHSELDEFIADEELSENYITQEGDILVRLRVSSEAQKSSVYNVKKLRIET